jgi:di/tripeptidase
MNPSVNFPYQTPTESLAELGAKTLQHLGWLISFDTQSDENSASIPSTPGQGKLIQELERFFAALGLSATVDSNSNLIVILPPSSGLEDAPAIALMAHVDTSAGTCAIERLIEVPEWNGEALAYPENPALIVDCARYPHIECLRGQTIIHGPGKAPYGLDNKVGLSELMSLAETLVAHPEIPHGEIVLGFRPDEEIGRHATVASLATTLAERGVRFGWTVDGSTPFEINTSNFNAARADVLLPTEPLNIPPCPFAQELTIEIRGVDTHGATAHEEGYLNAAIVFARVFERLDLTQGILPVDFDRTQGKETTGILKALVIGDEAAVVAEGIKRLLTALELEIREHRWKGAAFSVLETRSVDLGDSTAAPRYDDGACAVAVHLSALLQMSSVSPLLSEESSGNQGYTNPHWVSRTPEGMIVRYRLRDFVPQFLKRRGEDLGRICERFGGSVTITDQYVDMGPSLKAAPELLELPLRAFAPLAEATPFKAFECPIRGGTGVDAFTDNGVLIGNIGTGYYFLESAKELTTKELLALHTCWLINLVQAVVQKESSPSVG